MAKAASKSADPASTSADRPDGKRAAARRAPVSQSSLLSLPSVLAYRRALEITDAVMTAARSDDPLGAPGASILVYDHGKRTTASYEAPNRKKAGEPGRRTDDSRNLVFGEEAKLPADCDTLCVTFGLRVLPIGVEPDSCDDTAWHVRLTECLAQARSSDAVRVLARYYAYNLANGSWLWRNRQGADQIRIEIRFGDRLSEENLVIEDALDLSGAPVLGALEQGEDPHEGCREIDALAERFARALSGESRGLRIRASARLLMEHGQAVWPSQLYTPVRARVAAKLEKGRSFFCTSTRATDAGVQEAPAISAEKLGNALRTFDRDHGDVRFPNAVIPAEPNGSSLRRSVNLRGAGNRFFDHLKTFVNAAPHGNGPALTEEQLRYVLAIFVRGGVFGSSEREVAVDAEEVAA